MQLTSMDQDLFNKFRGQDTSSLLKNSDYRLFKKGQMRGARENRSFDCAQDRLEA